MRYLKVTAQDRRADGMADTVHFQFYKRTPGSQDDKRVFAAVAADLNADGKVDLLCAGDVNNDGNNNAKDRQLLKAFAKAYLKLSWGNKGDSRERYMQIFSETFTTDGTPEAVRLNFHGSTIDPIGSSVVYSASAYDADNDGRLEWSVNDDVDNDGDSDKMDEHLVKSLANTYRKFNWM